MQPLKEQRKATAKRNTLFNLAGADKRCGLPSPEMTPSNRPISENGAFRPPSAQPVAEIVHDVIEIVIPCVATIEILIPRD